MRKHERKELLKRLFSLALAVVMLVGYLPATASAAETADTVGKVADTETWKRLRPVDNAYLYKNDSLHAGKVTVDKSVTAGTFSHDGTEISPSDDENFIVTISQMAQVMALTTKMDTPVDVVFVLDTSGSMSADVVNSNGVSTGKNRSETVIELVNDTIENLMEANEYNRVGVVAFSAYNTQTGTAGGDAANVLSPLAHYTDGNANSTADDAASNHLTYGEGRVNWGGWFDVITVVGRNPNGSTGGSRYYTGGATNIQAGIAKGASLLMNADTTVDIDGHTVTRMPFLILLSDGAPVTSSSNNEWYNPSMTLTQGTNGDPLRVGNCFLPLLTAAYYKQQISNKYYPNGEGAVSVYTMGFAVDADETDMSAMTLNPSEELANTSNDWYTGIHNAWDQYAANNKNFSIDVGRPAELASGYSHDQKYYFYYRDTAVDIDDVNDIQDNTTSKKAETYYGVSGKNATVMFEDNIVDSLIPSNKSISALAYNDGYFRVNDADALKNAFESIMTEISQKAIASPTQVSTGDYNFDGYVTFTDVIGEYMEVKDVKGLLTGHNFYQGSYVAQNLGAQGSDAAFDAMALKVVATRFKLADPSLSDEDAQAKAAALINAATTNNTFNNQKTQAYYESETDYSNSLVWFGKSYKTGDGFERGVQYIAPAVDDSVEYLATATIPSDADTVCRSYLFYGAPEDSDDVHQLMYFMVRVERNLKTLQQTVTISAPASLLSVEKVYITEDTTGTKTSYTAKVDAANPTHVIYEVGLRSDINEYNVAQKVSGGYINEAVSGTGHVNYKDGTYYFFTNDWDRTKAAGTLERAQSKATFYAASNNPYYTYQEDTYIRDAQGNILKSLPSDGIAYYYRDVYSWSGSANAEGEYTATKTTTLIKINLSGAAVTTTGALRADADGQIYITKGTHTAAVVSDEESVFKNNNETNTSSVTAHPDRTGDANNSHYTVYLGNNGVLSLKSMQSKTVSVGSSTANDNGKAVMIGDTLTYKIAAKNLENTKATVVVTDAVPAGTEFVSASENGVHDPNTGIVTWTFTDVDAGAVQTVSFTVKVTEAALSLPGDITNSADVSINNNPAYTTNVVYNPPEGKTVILNANTDSVKVGDEVTFSIRFANDTDSEMKIVVEDTLPAGTTFVSSDYSDKMTREGDKLTWTFDKVEAGFDDYVNFTVLVTSAIGNASEITNQAAIKIGNDPQVTRETNEVKVKVDKGNLALTKNWTNPNTAFTEPSFTLKLSEESGLLSGSFNTVITHPNASDAVGTVTFTGGEATVTISHEQTVTIEGLPAGAVICVKEADKDGFTASYSAEHVTIAKDTAASVTVTNVYSAKPVDVVLSGTKELSEYAAEILQGVAFRFTLTEYDNEKQAVKEDAVPLNAEAIINGKSTAFQFPKLTFSTAGTYYYLVQEVNTGMTGVGYDVHSQVIEILVEDKGAGQLSATVKKDGKALDDTTNTYNVETYTNTYTPQAVELKLSGTKTMTGRPMRAGEFEFIVTDVNGNVVTRGFNAADGHINFGSLRFTEADMEGIAVDKTKDFTFRIHEVDVGHDQITYDKDGYEIKITVKHGAGKLEVTNVTGATFDSQTGVISGLDFQNTFTPKQISLVITAQKKLVNNSGESVSLNEGDFRFQMVGEDQTVTARNAAGGNVDNSATGNALITFNPLYYTAADIGKTYIYTLSEIHPGIAALPNMHYAENQPKIQVTVSQNATNHELQLVVVAQDAEGNFNVPLTITDGKADSGAVFINTLYPASISLTIPVNKTTVNNDEQMTPYTGNATFSFLVVDKNEKQVSANVGPANGHFNLAPLTFTEPGDYVFYVKEAHTGTVHGITHDAAYYQVDIKVERVNGELKFATDYPKFTQISTETNSKVINNTLQFNNVYDAKGTLIGLTAKKVLTGRDLRNGEFSFKLVRQDTNEEIAGSMAADGVITFATLYFNMDDLKVDETSLTERVLVYTMSEVIPEESKRIPGVTYDLENANGSLIYIKIKNDGAGGITAQLVADENGTPFKDGETEITDKKDTGVVFKNKYEVQKGASLTLNLSKELYGMTLTEKQFDFQMYRFVDTEKDGVKNGVYDEGEELYLVSTATNDANGNVVFYREFPATTPKGTYNYFIVEAHGGQTFIHYDEDKHYFTMTVDHAPETAQLTLSVQSEGFAATTDSTASAAKYDTDIVFNNYYNAAGTSVVPDASKKLVNTYGGQITKMTAGDFLFQVKLYAKTSDGKLTTVSDAEKTVASEGFNTADGDVVFGAITYKDNPSGTGTAQFLYEIYEVDTEISGVEYSTAKYYMLVEIQDNAQGQLIVNKQVYYTAENVQVNAEGTVTLQGIGSADKPVFENVYKPLPDTVNLVVHKTLTGREMAFNEFRFEAKQVTRTDNGESFVYVTNNAVYASGGNDEAGAESVVTFSSISFLVAGDYWFEITERTDLALPGVTMDSSKYYAMVKVDRGTKGVLKANAPVYYKFENGQLQEIDKVTFTNAYTAEPATVALSALKILTGRDLAADDFTFTLTGNIGNTAVNQSKTNDADGNVVFDTMTFDKAGTYTFTVSEVDEDKPGYTYGPNGVLTSYTVTVTVTDDGKGQLHAAVSYTSNTSREAQEQHMVFHNSYKAPAINPDLSLQINGKKSVVDALGNPLSKLDGFRFNVYNIKNETVSTGVSLADGTIKFAPFTFTEPGEYIYWIAEAEDNDPSYDIDPRVWFVHIVVRYNQTNETLTFTDGGETITVTPGSLYILPKDVTTDEYYGTVVQDEETAEQVGASSPSFVNVFNPDPVSVTVKAKKLLTGREMQDHEFLFVLKDSSGMVWSQVRNHAGGTVDFNLTVDGADMLDGNTVLTEKTFNFTISEVIPDDAVNNVLNGVTYSKTVGTVSITVKNEDGVLKVSGNNPATVNSGVVIENTYTPEKASVTINAQKILEGAEIKDHKFTFELVDANDNVVASAHNDANGNVTIAMSYDKAGVYTYTLREKAGKYAGMDYDESKFTVTVTVTDDLMGKLYASVAYDATPVFKNVYNGTSVSDTIEAKKEIVGRTLKDAEFTFELADSTGKTVIDTVTNDAEGKIQFAVTYTEPGDYTYILREKKGDDKLLKYDDSAYKVTVVVTKDADGNLSSEVVYDTADKAMPVFRNIHTPGAVPVPLEGFKALSGGTMTAEQFKFVVVDEDGKQVGSGTNDETGKIVFTGIAFDKAGEYELTVSEVNTGVLGMSYDTAEFKVTVEVTNNNGELTAKVTYPEGGIKFVNTYRTPDAQVEVKLEGFKALTGGTMTAEKFKFKVVDENGKQVGTGTNDEKGRIIFTGITFEKVGKYELTVSEVNTGILGMTYDTTEFKVTVEVTNNNGELKAKVTYPEGGIKFANTYREPDELVEVKLEGTKSLTGGTMTAEKFKFKVVDENGKQIATGTNDKDGKIVFNGIAFDKAGKYELTVSEVNTGVLGMTYDTAEFKVTVEVTDNNGDLTAKVTYPEGGIKFANTYREPDELVEVKLEGTKSLTGGTMKAEQFKFRVVDKYGKQIATGTNDKDGKIVFTGIAFDKAGKYELTVTEVNTGILGMTYDTAEFKVTVEVTDNNGDLTAKVTYPEGGIKFANTYRTPDTEIKVGLEATKTLTGRKLKDKEFEFQVHDSNGKLVATGTNAKDGKITFTDVVLKEAGKYELTVTEVKGKETNVIYDDAKFKVTVEVTDDNGVLSAKVTYPEKGIKFENIYKKPAADSPATGDNTPVALLICVMTISLAGILLMIFVPRGKNMRGKYSK